MLYLHIYYKYHYSVMTGKKPLFISDLLTAHKQPCVRVVSDVCVCVCDRWASTVAASTGAVCASTSVVATCAASMRWIAAQSSL